MGDRALDLLIRAERVVAGGREEPRAIGVRGGVIAALLPIGASALAAEEITIGPDAVVLPGVVDTHVHVCEPGNAAWEGFATATAAAAAGGITTLVDMPIDSVPATVDPDALAAKRQATEGQLRVDVGFWGGVVPTNLGSMDALLDAGVVGFKCFLTDSGAEDFPPLDDRSLELALTVTARTGVPLMVHAEDLGGVPAAPPSRRYADWLATRPRATEDRAVARVVEATRRTKGRAHIAHLSSATALPALAAARAEGVAVTAETCPHYLLLCAEEIGDGDTAAKCGPPVRDAANRTALWEGLAAGVLGSVVSDHSPCLPEMKSLGTGDFSTAWAGISSLQVALPAAWTAARARGFRLTDLVRWMAEAPADLAGLTAKGRIAVGADADLCVMAPEETFVVDRSCLLHRHPVCPYVGMELVGVVRATMLGGHWVEPEGPPTGEAPEEARGMNVLVVNVNTNEHMTATIAAAARRAASPGTEIVALTPRFGAGAVDSAFESYLSAVAVMDCVVAHEGPYDAVVLAGFGEHGRDGLQELVTAPVIEICEASAHVAQLVGRTYSVVTTLQRSVPLIEDRLRLAGLADRCASVRASGLATAEVDADPEGSARAVLEQARQAVEEDHAEVICLGCAGFAGLEDAIRAELGVPAVDGVAAAVALAEAVVGLGLTTSKRWTYAPPEPKPIAGWPLTHR